MRLLIQTYLESHSSAELESAYGIRAKPHTRFSNLIMLSYSQISSPMSEPIVQQCRGIILDQADNWRVVSYPFDKFFNYGEPNAAPIDWPSATVFEKLDGSLMTLYWYKGEWHVASSGTPDASGPAHESDITFADLFWETSKGLNYTLPENSNCCYMFELMTPRNRVIVQHQVPRLVLIGVRRLDTFEEVEIESIASANNWQCVACLPLSSLADCVSAASKLRGLDGEGFVVRDSEFRRIKVKCPQYVALSHMKDSLSPRAMLEVIRKGESEEFLNYFPEVRPAYEGVKLQFEAMCAQLLAEFNSAKGIESQRDFALAIKHSRCPSALFSVRNGKAKTIHEHFANATQAAVERAIGWKLENVT
jgi:RNA ligase